MLEAPRWALNFYLRHLPVVLALSMIPAVERFTGQLWERPAPVGLACEVITLAAWVAFVVFAIRSVRTRLRWSAKAIPGLAVQFGLIGVLFVLADVVPENVMPALVHTGPLYWAFLLGIKNLTVIPFTMLWLVGMHRLFVDEPVTTRLR